MNQYFQQTKWCTRPFLTRIPDQTLLVEPSPLDGDDHIRATQDIQGTYAFIYFPNYRKVTVDLSKLSGDHIRVSWYDVRNGDMKFDGEVRGKTLKEFAPPAGGPDWVLVLDSVVEP